MCARLTVFRLALHSRTKLGQSEQTVNLVRLVPIPGAMSERRRRERRRGAEHHLCLEWRHRSRPRPELAHTSAQRVRERLPHSPIDRRRLELTRLELVISLVELLAQLGGEPEMLLEGVDDLLALQAARHPELKQRRVAIDPC